MTKMGLSLGLVALFVLLCFAAYVRLAPSDPALWHVDPLTVARPDKPNFVLLRPEDATTSVASEENARRDARNYAMTPDALMQAFDEIAMASPRVTRLAGSVEARHVTYVARSNFWGFPDYVSVRAVPAEGGARLVAFSRARFGYSDQGVNARRMTGWLDRLSRPAT